MGQVQGSMLEGLFQRALAPRGAFADELKKAGYDLARPEPVYDDEVWARCLEVAARHVCPGQGYPEAERELGRKFASGFAKTLIGSVTLAVVPRLSREHIFERMSRWVSVGSKQLAAEVVEKGERLRVLRVTTSGVRPHPFLMAGIVEALLRRPGEGMKVEVTASDASGYTLRVSW
jgi:uncharacterized protein (TIGR02265 family)